MRKYLVNQWLTKLKRKLTVGSTICLEKGTFGTTSQVALIQAIDSAKF